MLGFLPASSWNTLVLKTPVPDGTNGILSYIPCHDGPNFNEKVTPLHASIIQTVQNFPLFYSFPTNRPLSYKPDTNVRPAFASLATVALLP